MSKAKSVGKRSLAIVLTIAMMITTLITFNIGSVIGSAANTDSGAITVTENAQENVYFYVPEQIYLAPDLDSYKTQDRYNFQWYVDSSIDKTTHLATPRTGENASGNFYFYYKNASSITVTFKYLNQDGSDMAAYTSTSQTNTANYANQNSTIKLASNSVEMSAINTRSDVARTRYTVASNTLDTTVQSTGSLSPYLAANSKGYYIQWTVNYVDSTDGITKAIRAYTYVYKPFVEPIGAAAKAKGAYHNIFASSILWVSGVHGYTNGDSNSLWYVQTGNFVPMLGLIKEPSNNNPDTNWIQSGSNGVLSPTINYQSIEAGMTKYHARANSISPTATLTVDTSRYTNFNQIPNFKIGFMNTDRDNANNASEWYIADYGTSKAINTDSYRNGTADGSSRYTSEWNDKGSIFIEGSADNTGVQYNTSWNKAISGTSSFRIKSGYATSTEKVIVATAWNYNFVNINVTGINKTGLRDAYERATNAAAYLGLCEDGSTAYYDYSSAAWNNWVALYLAAGQLLANLDATSTVVNGTTYSCDQLAAALDAAVANVQTVRRTSVAQVRFLAIEMDAAGNYILKNLKNMKARADILDESIGYKYGDTITYTAPEAPGYRYIGYIDGMNYNVGQDIGADYTTVLSGTATTLSKPYISTPDVKYTFVYAPSEISSIVDTEGGIYNFMKTLTSDIPSEIAGAGYPTATARPDSITDFNYKVEGNDVIAWTNDVNTREQYMFLPFYVDTTASSSYRVTYDVTGTDASNVKISLISNTFTGGNGDSTSEYTVAASGGVFKTNAVDAARAYVKLELTGDARNGKTVRISNICFTHADHNELRMDTTQGYPAVYTAPTSAPKTDMNYTASDVANVVVTTRYSTLMYEQYQMLPYYIQLKPNCSYGFTYDVSGIDASKVKLSLYSVNFTGGNGSTMNYYEFGASGSSITVGANDDAVAQLRVDILDANASTNVTISNLCIENLDTKTTVEGTLNQTTTLSIPVKEGFALSGWNLKSNSGGSSNGTIAETGNDRIYEYTFGSGIDIIEAAWVPATMNVVFRAEDGTVISEQDVIYGNDATAPATAPEKFGHTFAGWDTDFTNVTKNLIIEPTYTEKDIAVTVTAEDAEIYAKSTTQVSATFEPNEPEINAVEWTSSNNAIATVDSNGVVTGVAEGTVTITGTITYDGRTYSGSTTIKVNPVVVTAIAVNTMPDKTTYYTGDTFDPTGLTLTVTYNNGTTEVVSEGMTFNTVNTTYAGSKNVRVTYEGKTATFRITVVDLVIEGIEVTAPSNTEYFIGDEELDTTGLKVVAVYNNGTKVELEEGDYELDGFDTSAPGEVEILVYYEDFEASFTITVKSLDVTKIAIKTPPTKTEYFVGESANYAGLALAATYSNGVTATITDGYTVTGFDSATAGTKTLTVEYEGKTATFTVNVKAVELEKIEIVTPAAKTEYFTGEEADFSGLTIKATYNNGTTETLATGFNVTGFDSATAGQKTITVEYKGKTVTFPVTIKAIELTSIEIATPAEKTEYFVGEEADYAGLTIKANYNNGTTAMVDGYTITGFDSQTAGQKTITVAYEGKTVTFTVNVKAIELVSIEIATNPAKTTYYTNEVFDATGLTLTATYNNGTTATITEGFAVGAVDMATAGTKNVTVTYEGQTASFNITVNALYITNVELDTMPNKTEYMIGEAEDNTGLTLKVTYNDGSTKVVSEGFVVYGFDSTVKGTVTLMVEYEGYYVTFDVTVLGKADFSKVDDLLAKFKAEDPSAYTNYDEIYFLYVYDFENTTLPLSKEAYTSEKDQPEVDALYDELLGYYNMLEPVVTVVLDSIAVSTAPNKVEYNVGDAFDAIGLTIKATYSDGSSVTITEGFTLSNVDMTTAGTKTVTVTYEGKTATFEITVIEEVQIVERFEIVGGASVKTQGGVNYIVGLQPSLTKAKFQSTYADYENVTLVYNMTTARYMGTGSTITVKSTLTGEVIAEYVIVIYGDVDGTATINGRDAAAVSNSITGVADSLTGAAKLAANVEGTRATINAKDASVIRAVAGGSMTIDQSTGKGVEI